MKAVKGSAGSIRNNRMRTRSWGVTLAWTRGLFGTLVPGCKWCMHDGETAGDVN